MFINDGGGGAPRPALPKPASTTTTTTAKPASTTSSTSGSSGGTVGARPADSFSRPPRTPDGKYLVSDPMWTGGAVTMTLEQLKVFTGSNPLITTVGQ